MQMMRRTLHSADETADFAAALGARLGPGDTILLAGSVGAGKTHFARSLIRSLTSPHEDVPSPTFTLVQTYAARVCEIWHADLYRLTDPAEIEELGLLDATDSAICLVEWPDRMGELRPRDALDLCLADGPKEDTREMVLCWQDMKWGDRLLDLTE